jgi:hypothetical protein
MAACLAGERAPVTVQTGGRRWGSSIQRGSVGGEEARGRVSRAEGWLERIVRIEALGGGASVVEVQTQGSPWLHGEAQHDSRRKGALCGSLRRACRR